MPRPIMASRGPGPRQGSAPPRPGWPLAAGLRHGGGPRVAPGVAPLLLATLTRARRAAGRTVFGAGRAVGADAPLLSASGYTTTRPTAAPPRAPPRPAPLSCRYAARLAHPSSSRLHVAHQLPYPRGTPPAAWPQATTTPKAGRQGRRLEAGGFALAPSMLPAHAGRGAVGPALRPCSALHSFAAAALRPGRLLMQE